MSSDDDDDADANVNVCGRIKSCWSNKSKKLHDYPLGLRKSPWILNDLSINQYQMNKIMIRQFC